MRIIKCDCPMCREDKKFIASILFVLIVALIGGYGFYDFVAWLFGAR